MHTLLPYTEVPVPGSAFPVFRSSPDFHKVRTDRVFSCLSTSLCSQEEIYNLLPHTGQYRLLQQLAVDWDNCTATAYGAVPASLCQGHFGIAPGTLSVAEVASHVLAAVALLAYHRLPLQLLHLKGRHPVLPEELPNGLSIAHKANFFRPEGVIRPDEVVRYSLIFPPYEGCSAKVYGYCFLNRLETGEYLGCSNIEGTIGKLEGQVFTPFLLKAPTA